MRVQIPLVVEMTDDQVADYAEWAGLENPRADEIEEAIRAYILHHVQILRAFCLMADGTRGADVTQSSMSPASARTPTP